MPHVRALPTVLIVALVPWAVQAQSVNNWSIDPLVIPAVRSAPAIIEVTVAGSPTRVYLEFQPTNSEVDLRDDGVAPDRRAGDAVYTASLSTTAIVAALRADDVQRVFVGFLNLMNGSTRVVRLNIFASVYSGAVPAVPISPLSGIAQSTSRLVNIVDPDYLADSNTPRVVRTFYQYFPDDFDFLNIITIPSRSQNRSHQPVRNDVAGIGASRFDNSRNYGSGGRLQGINFFPIDAFFDGASTGYNHEIGHQWISYLNFPPLSSGLPHWPYSSLGGGVMGISIAGTNVGGNFSCTVVQDNGVIRLLPRPEEPVFADLDLYLMGLVGPDQVGDAIVFDDQNAARTLGCSGQTFGGPVQRVSVQSVIGQVGPRLPASANAQRNFRIATIIVSRDALVSAEAMWLYSWLAARAEGRSPVPVHEGFSKVIGKPFFVATGGRATLDTLLRPDTA